MNRVKSRDHHSLAATIPPQSNALSGKFRSLVARRCGISSSAGLRRFHADRVEIRDGDSALYSVLRTQTRIVGGCDCFVTHPPGSGELSRETASPRRESPRSSATASASGGAPGVSDAANPARAEVRSGSRTSSGDGVVFRGPAAGGHVRGGRPFVPRARFDRRAGSPVDGLSRRFGSQRAEPDGPSGTGAGRAAAVRAAGIGRRHQP